MSKIKFAAGLVILVGVPAAFGLIFAGLGYGYANQHVHDVIAQMQGYPAELGAGYVPVKINDYYHSAAGVVAVSGVLALVWVAFSTLGVLLGGTMIAKRDKRWD